MTAFLLGIIMNKQENITYKIGTICAIFRKYQLKKTLKELSKETGINVSTLSAFEHGRSTNMELMFKYIVSCKTEEQECSLLRELIDAIKDNKGGC